MRIHLAKNIQAQWFKPAAALLAASALFAAAPKHSAPVRAVPSGAGLPELVRAYRDSPSPARRAAIEAYAKAHAKETSGSQARLALGVAAYEQKDFPGAIENLRGLGAKLPRIADYVAYYAGAARVESNDFDGVGRDLEPVHAGAVPSPFAGRAWLIEARALKSSQPAEAVRLLREHYNALPQPEGDVTLADSYQAANDLPHAAEFYQRVYYQRISGDASARAAAALLTLQDTMGAAYPQPTPQARLERADRFLEAREYREARREYQTIASQLSGLEKAQARVRVGAADFLGGNTATAYPYLRALEVTEPEADAERLFYLEECARRLTDEDEVMAVLARLAKQYPHSPWRLKALLAAANRYLVTNRSETLVSLYKAAYESFPDEPAAAPTHWRVAFQAYLENQSDAPALMREHLQRYSNHFTAGGALYFLGRGAEGTDDFATAAAYYTQLGKTFPNTYYAMLARQRLSQPEVAKAGASPKTSEFLASLTLPEARPVPAESSAATAARIERSRLLRAAGLADLADSELRFGARTDGQPPLLGMELASSSDQPYLGLRAMKSMAADYLNLPLASAPDKFWRLLFPMPFRQDLVASAQERDLDPYLIAGLIRQESEFNPQALSRANAYGLTQVRPVTGRQYARTAGVPAFTNRVLFQPAANLKIGTTVFRSMLDHNNGSLELTLAAYNAGPTRAAEWQTWRTYREPAEFVESIPFTETRDYVQAVLRNADIYRRIYR